MDLNNRSNVFKKKGTVTKIFGIRHHGPGSAHRLLRALAQYNPDCLLVEAPADAESACRFLNEPQLEPPVALLLYNPDKVGQAAYYPFAVFSPEWQAMRWAYKSGIPVRLIDLPAANMLAMSDTQTAQIQLDFAHDPPDAVADDLRADPLGYMARLAGFEDTERWWELTFEHHQDDIEVFDAVQELMAALRSELGRHENPHNLIREAHLRKVIRQTHKDGFQRPAVVCGAWHGPALEDVKQYNPTADSNLLKGLAKVKVKATWIPKNGGWQVHRESWRWLEVGDDWGDIYDCGGAVSALR